MEFVSGYMRELTNYNAFGHYVESFFRKAVEYANRVYLAAEGALNALLDELDEDVEIVELDDAYFPADNIAGMTDLNDKKIWVRKRLTYVQKRFVIGHEIGHRLLRKRGLKQDEDVCDSIAANALGLRYRPI